MTIKVLCPNGHAVEVDESRVGATAACLECLTPFDVERSELGSHHARAKPSKRRRDDDDDDDEEDDDDEDEDERPAKKKKKSEGIKKPEPEKPRRSRRDSDDDDDDDNDDDRGPKVFSKQQRNLQMVRLGLGFMQGGIIALALLPFVNFMAGLVTAGAGPAGIAGFDIVSTIATVFQFLSIAAVDALIAIGISFGFFAPAKAEVRGTVVGALICIGLMVFFLLIAGLGLLGVFVEDPVVAKNLGNLFIGLFGLIELVFFVIAMVYLKSIAGFLRDILLASEPINILFEFTFWYVIPLVGLILIEKYVDFTRELDLITIFVIMGFWLFMIGGTIRSYFLLFRWINCVVKLRALVQKTIDDM